MTVEPVELESLSLKNKKIYLEGEETLIPEYVPQNASEGINALIWESDNPEIAKVDERGRVYGLAVGKTIISVRSENNPNIYSSCTITVAATNYKDGTKFKAQTAEGINLWFKVLSVSDKTVQMGYYTENSDYEITGHSIDGNYSGHLVIPSKVNGYTVVSISDYAFRDYDSDLTITIPNSVGVIGWGAFLNCKKLHSITLPEKELDIQSYAFDGCSSLSYINIPEGVKKIDPFAFKDCITLSSISLPTTLSEIGSAAFYGCSNLTAITIPENVTSIGSRAFYGCRNLESLNIPDHITSIGKLAFKNVPWYENFPDGVAYLGAVLYEYKGSMPPNTNIVVKEGTLSISPEAFREQENLEACFIPNSVKEIGTSAFSKCSGLKSIVLSDNLSSIEKQTFYQCSSLISIVIPADVTVIRSEAFSKCISLQSVTLPEQLTKIYSKAFIKDTKIGEIVSYISSPFSLESSSQVFDESIYSKCILKVPIGKKSIYEDLSVWKKFTNIVEMDDTPDDEVTIEAKNYNRLYGEPNPTFEYDVTKGTIQSGTPSASCSATATSPVGTYDIVISKGTVSNNTVNLVNGTLTIAKAPLTISARNDTIQQGQALPTFTATYAGFKNGETSAVLTTQPSLTTTATSSSSPGTYDIIVSGAAAQNYEITYVKGTLTIAPPEPDPIRGDLNNDKNVNGTDLVIIADLILHDQFNPLADLHPDGDITGTDFVMAADIVLNWNPSATKKMAPATRTISPACLSIEDFTIKAGETKEMLIDLTNTDAEVTLVQFDLRLPDGLSIVEEDGELVIDIAGRTTWRKHTLAANAINDITRFLLASQTNAVISDTDGAVIKVKLQADNDFNGGYIELCRQLIVTPNAEEIKPTDYKYLIGDLTSIENITNCPPYDVYSLNGYKVRSGAMTLKGLQKGVYLINNKIVIIK